jgi:hypothetical protein
VLQEETHKNFNKIKPDYIDDDDRLINKIGVDNYKKYKHIFEDENNNIKNEKNNEYSGMQYEQLYKYNLLATKQLILYCESLEKRISELEKKINV